MKAFKNKLSTFGGGGGNTVFLCSPGCPESL